MAEPKKLNTRIQLKHDVAANWALAVNFSPKEGEVIIYDEDENHNFPRIKVGDGSTNVNKLPFVFEPVTKDDIDNICGTVLRIGEEVKL